MYMYTKYYTIPRTLIDRFRESNTELCVRQLITFLCFAMLGLSTAANYLPTIYNVTII